MTTTADAQNLAAWLGRKPALAYTDPDGYRYDETDVWWKQACASLPCFEAMKWPDYGTAIVEDVIDGKPVVIQLWKGWCQRFFGSNNFPGASVPEGSCEGWSAQDGGADGSRRWYLRRTPQAAVQ